MSGDNLKPCPFCGGEARLTRWLRGWWPVAIHAGWCVMNVMEPPKPAYYISEKAAADAWNTRKGE